MMRVYFFICFHFLIVISCFTQTLDRNGTFEEANKNYDLENYNEAIEQYNSVLANSQESFELYYNLAMSYSQVDDYPRAILYLEKALKLKPNHKLSQSMLETFRKASDIEITKIDDFILISFWNKMASILSPMGWLIVEVLCGIWVIFTFYTLVFRSKEFLERKRRAIGLAAGILALVISVGLGFSSDKIRFNNSAAVLMVDGQLHSGADSRSPQIRELKAGNHLEILDQIDEWIKVLLVNKEEGWIEVSKVEII